MNQSFPVHRRHISTLKRSHSDSLLGINSLYPKRKFDKDKKEMFLLSMDIKKTRKMNTTGQMVCNFPTKGNLWTGNKKSDFVM